jgi:ATP-binding cassette subfamily F protein 3
VALLGPNGAGKSTLVKTLVGELPLLAGERNVHGDLRIGYFAQHTVESLRAGATPMDHLRDIAPEASTQDMRSFLGRWYFSGQRAFQAVDVFSGGERARLALSLIAWRKPNVLLLDEPTNHLDLDMREALAEALSDFDGAIVLVSHDRHLIGLVCDTFWRVADGRVEPFEGDLDEYATWLGARANKSAAGSTGAGRSSAPTPAPEVKKTNPKAGRRQQEVARLEAKLLVMATELATLEGQLSDPGVYAGRAQELAGLASRHAAVREAHEALEMQWLTLYGQLEAG